MEMKSFSPSRKRKRTFVGRVAKRRLAPRAFRGRRVGPSQEWKFLDVQIDDALIAQAGTVTPSVNLIAQGVTESNRVGRKCSIRSISWRWNLQMKSQAVMSSTSDSVRLIVYIDKQANGATAAVLDILETANFQSFNNLSNSGRFRVLYDKMMNTQQNAAIAGPVTNEQDLNGTFHKALNLPIEFSGTGGTIDEIRSNNIGLLVISFGGFTSLVSKIRIRFSDS